MMHMAFSLVNSTESLYEHEMYTSHFSSTVVGRKVSYYSFNFLKGEKRVIVPAHLVDPKEIVTSLFTGINPMFGSIHFHKNSNQNFAQELLNYEEKMVCSCPVIQSTLKLHFFLS